MSDVPKETTETQEIAKTLHFYIEYFLLSLSILLVVWIVFDAAQRFKNRFLIPLIAIIVGFAPYVIAKMIGFENAFYFLSSAIFFWMLYLFIRPEYTREEMRIIEAEQKIKDITRKYYEREILSHDPFCPVCSLPVKDDFLICPNCYKELRGNCHQCGRLIEKSWAICPYCKTKLKRGNTDELKDI